MTRILPDYIFTHKQKYQIIDAKNVIFVKSTHPKKDMISLRNSMHLAILLLHGTKVLHLKDKNEKIDTSKILYLRQGNYFLTEFLGDKNSFETLLIYFDDGAVLDFLKSFEIDLKKDSKKDICNLKRDDFMDLCIKNIDKYFEQNIKIEKPLIKLKFQELLMYSFLADFESMSGFLNSIISSKSNRLKLILESNIDIIDSVETMLKLTRISREGLRKEMKKIYNQTPKQWLDTQRFKKAKNLLKNEDLSLTDIATSCGYSTLSWFITQFKNKFGTTPTKYRQNLNK